MAGACAAIGLGQGGAEEAELAHLGHDLTVEPLLGKGGDDAGQEALAGVVARRLGDHALVFRQTPLQVERIVPPERLLRRGADRGGVVERHLSAFHDQA